VKYSVSYGASLWSLAPDIISLFNDALSTEVITYCRMKLEDDRELFICKDLNGGHHSLFESVGLIFGGETEENYVKD
jgi:hypothetical protein